MDSLPLPPSPSLEQYQKRAKDLVKAARSQNQIGVHDWAHAWVHALAKSLGTEVAPSYRPAVDRAIRALETRVAEQVKRVQSKGEQFSLADAQFLIASAHGFTSWGDFAAHIEPSDKRDAARGSFERAVDAVVSGDIETLTALLRAEPELVRAHSAREHRATLLHYVAANGVEDYRQRTPKNAVEIARFLLEKGAPVDALANTYGNDWWQTTMNLLVSSAHPAGAGLMPALVDVLVDFGAAVNGPRDDETPLFTALEFGYYDAAVALVRRGARVDNVATAAALGRLDLVRQFVIDKQTLKPGVPLIAAPWRHLPDDPTRHIELALAWACKFGHSDVAEFLLDLGVNPRAKDGYDMTALHWAAANGMMSVVDRLLRLGVPLEAENTWGGTVLNSTLHFVVHQPAKGVDYAAVIQRLLDAGADVSVVDPEPTGNAMVDEVIRRRRAQK